jgi:hypothetical protein
MKWCVRNNWLSNPWPCCGSRLLVYHGTLPYETAAGTWTCAAEQLVGLAAVSERVVMFR